MTTKHTPGPWRWEFNGVQKSVCLVGGVPQFDKTVMQFERWGMSGAVPAFNDKITGNVWNVMERLCDKPEWLSPFEGRKHHVEWCANVVHPDARLIAAAPDLLEALIKAEARLCHYEVSIDSEWGHCRDYEHIEKDKDWSEEVYVARAAIAKATGEQE